MDDEVKMTPSQIADDIAEIASVVAGCAGLEPRDRNAAIGQLRTVAAFVRGAAGLKGFRQAAFAPTTTASPKPEGT